MAEEPPPSPSSPAEAAACKMSAMQKEGFFMPAGSRGKQPPGPGPAGGAQYAADQRLKLEA